MRKMKKSMRGAALLLALAVALLAGCGQKAQAGKSLKEQGQELVSLMGEMAASGDYVSFYTDADEMRELLSAAGEGDHSSPTAVYSIRFPDSALDGLLALAGLDSLDGLSQGLQASIKARVVAALPTQVNAMGGSNVLAAASLCTASKTFLSGEVSENVIYLYVYEDAVPAAVVFLPGEDGTVSATGMLILYDGFQAGGLEKISGQLEQLGAEVGEVSE